MAKSLPPPWAFIGVSLSVIPSPTSLTTPAISSLTTNSSVRDATNTRTASSTPMTTPS